MNFRRPAAFLWLFIAFTAIGLFFTLHTYLGDTPRDSLMFRRHLLWEMTGAWSAMLLIPFLAWVAERYPARRGNIHRVIAANAAALIAYTIAHTTIETAMRFAFAPLLDLHDAYGGFQYSAEAAGDVVYYALLVTSIYLANHFIASRDMEAKLAEAKLENLRLQLHPHFLFNTLNAISSVMYEDVERADAMLAKLSTFLRVVLDSDNVHTVPLEEELEIERMYVDIMTTRLERSLHLRISVSEDAKDSAVPFMLLQPLLENSIRHGMGSTRTSIDLGIDVSRVNGRTVIRVEDDGLGYDPDAAHGIGLSNVTSRLHYMYGGTATFAIEKRPNGGTCATLQFPYATGAAACR